MGIALDIVNNLIDNFDKIKSEEEYWRNELSIADKKIVDIKHKIEKHNFNASEGYKLARLLKETLIQRRKAKDNRARLGYLLRYYENHTKEIDKLNKVLHKIKCLNGQIENDRYNPRVLHELFKEE